MPLGACTNTKKRVIPIVTCQVWREPGPSRTTLAEKGWAMRGRAILLMATIGAVLLAGRMALAESVTCDGTPPCYGTPEGDLITGTDSGETIHALGGNDGVLSGAGDDTVYGGSGKDDVGAWAAATNSTAKGATTTSKQAERMASQARTAATAGAATTASTAWTVRRT